MTCYCNDCIQQPLTWTVEFIGHIGTVGSDEVAYLSRRDAANTECLRIGTQTTTQSSDTRAVTYTVMVTEYCTKYIRIAYNNYVERM